MKYHNQVFLVVFALCNLSCLSYSQSDSTVSQKQSTEIHSHKPWDELLSRYVSEKGQVNYAMLKSNPKKLNDYIQLLRQNPVNENWTRSQKLAYWINAYNAFTLKLIIDNYPVSSIRDIDRPWGKKFIQLGNEYYSLNQIENEIIRPTFREPRIHFALVCAAISCPKLLNKAYLPASLDQQLDQQTRYFISESGKNEIGNNQVKISKLFKWYYDDFTSGGTLLDFLNQYTDIELSSSAKVDYLEYNWGLNDSMNK